jgi:hypothetical protein
LAVYYGTYQLHATRQNDEALKEIKDATGNLFRVVGWLFTLLLSLTFTDVINELSVTETAIESEASAIEDVHHNLRRFGLDESREARNTLVEYVQAAIDDDWTALAEDELSPRANALLRHLGDVVLDLKTTNPRQETLKSSIIADVDVISDFRLSRLQQARGKPSLVLVVVLFGYFVTMVYFGIYEPRPALVALLSLYAVFVGVVIFLILAFSDPFQGAMAIDAAPMEYALETMRSA